MKFIIFKPIFIYSCILMLLFGCQARESKPNETVSETEISQIAKSITVRLFLPSTNISGSGVIIQRNQNDYLILTNEHVIDTALVTKKLKVQTPDGKSYTANVIAYPFVKDDDLAMVKLVTTEQYSVSRLGNSTSIKIGDRLYAAGFPADSEKSEIELKVSKGVASMITKPLVGGYQIGYSNEIERGMSGGPILNQQGEVIGVNGIRKDPSLGDPFAFVDGSIIPETTWQEMSKLSWGIPIERFSEVEKTYFRF